MSASAAFNFDFRPKTYWDPAISSRGRSQYLPDFLPGEVEIASITLPGTGLWDTSSVRARQESDGRIHYRVVDEYESQIVGDNDVSDLPLTFGELVRFLDSLTVASSNVMDEGVSYLWYLYTNGDLLEDRRIVSVDSPYYPDLRAYFQQYEEVIEKTAAARLEEVEADRRDRENRARAERAAVLEGFTAEIERILQGWRSLQDRAPGVPDPRHGRKALALRSYLEDYVVGHGVLPTGTQQLSIRVSLNRNEYFTVNIDQLRNPAGSRSPRGPA